LQKKHPQIKFVKRVFFCYNKKESKAICASASLKRRRRISFVAVYCGEEAVMFARLRRDIRVIFERDPAARSTIEVLLCYGGLHAIWLHRIAHALYVRGWVLLPRLISNFGRFLTGIEIHPGATIGEGLFIDHGTGVVIGETCVIGNNVKLYQGVTLGAKSFPLDDQGNPIKGIARHPIIEDNVVIYANATVLGRITIGDHCIVGANTWVLQDMKPGTAIYRTMHD